MAARVIYVEQAAGEYRAGPGGPVLPDGGQARMRRVDQFVARGARPGGGKHVDVAAVAPHRRLGSTSPPPGEAVSSSSPPRRGPADRWSRRAGRGRGGQLAVLAALDRQVKAGERRQDRGQELPRSSTCIELGRLGGVQSWSSAAASARARARCHPAGPSVERAVAGRDEDPLVPGSITAPAVPEIASPLLALVMLQELAGSARGGSSTRCSRRDRSGRSTGRWSPTCPS